jgi:hypothetical protein
VFWVPADARWESLRAKAKQPEIGQLIDKALVAYNPAVFDQAVEAIHQRYLPAMEQLFGFLQQVAP